MKEKKKRAGRPTATDKREVLPFRLKGSLVAVCRERGRDWLEKVIARAGEEAP